MPIFSFLSAKLFELWLKIICFLWRKNNILGWETPGDPKFFEFTLISHPRSPNEHDGPSYPFGTVCFLFGTEYVLSDFELQKIWSDITTFNIVYKLHSHFILKQYTITWDVMLETHRRGSHANADEAKHKVILDDGYGCLYTLVEFKTWSYRLPTILSFISRSYRLNKLLL